MFSWIRKINVKMSISNLQMECNFYQNPNGIFFYRKRKGNPKIHMESQRPQIAKAILRKKGKTVLITFSDFKLQGYGNSDSMVLD